jgi:hypothetical protein
MSLRVAMLLGRIEGSPNVVKVPPPPGSGGDGPGGAWLRVQAVLNPLTKTAQQLTPVSLPPAPASRSCRLLLPVPPCLTPLPDPPAPRYCRC